MTDFPSHTLETAPEASKPLLENSQKAFGRLPGLHKVLAESPQAYEAYQVLHKLFTETEFDADELTVVWQTCLLYTSPSPRDLSTSRMPSSA